MAFLFTSSINLIRNLTFWLLILSMLSCANIPDPDLRKDYAETIASQHNWIGNVISTDDFLLQSYLPSLIYPTDSLTIYIEGDGLAWITSSSPSSNPTPGNPLALKLALLDDSPSAYLARPCQYVQFNKSKVCSQKYWTNYRFAPEVIRATNQAIDQIKLRFNAKKIILVGYSGGGAVAALAAARRNDVTRLITIAGNLDHKTWTREKHLSALTFSLNPIDDVAQLQNIPQTHYVGGRDIDIGVNIARGYASKFPSSLVPSIVVIPDFDHSCCWEKNWPNLKYIDK